MESCDDVQENVMDRRTFLAASSAIGMALHSLPLVAGGHRELYDNPEMRKLLKPEVVWEIEGSFGMPAARVTDDQNMASR